MNDLTLSEIYKQLSDKPKLIRRWQRTANKWIRRFVKNIASASPFIDKPQKRMFGVRNSKDGQTLTIYGTSPNAGRMKTFNAPTDKWQAVTRAFRFFGGGDWHSDWHTIHKTQMVRRSAGTPIQDVPYYGTSEKPERFYGIKKGKTTLAYGKTDSGIALPVYAQDSYADWIMNKHLNEIENIILECGRDILAEQMFNGGAM